MDQKREDKKGAQQIGDGHEGGGGSGAQSVRSFFAAALKRAGTGLASSFSWDAQEEEEGMLSASAAAAGSSGNSDARKRDKATARVRKAWQSWIDGLEK